MSGAENKPVTSTGESVPQRLVCGTQNGAPGERRRAGRPHISVSAQEVTDLRDTGLSWRVHSRQLRIGTATAMRLYSAHHRHAELSQNPLREASA